MCTSNNVAMLEDTHVGTGSLNSPPKNIVIVFSTLEPIFAEPLFTGIKYGSPASENYMMIEPLFSESLGISKVNNNLSPSGVFTECYQSSLYRTCRCKGLLVHVVCVLCYFIHVFVSVSVYLSS